LLARDLKPALCRWEAADSMRRVADELIPTVPNQWQRYNDPRATISANRAARGL